MIRFPTERFDQGWSEIGMCILSMIKAISRKAYDSVKGWGQSAAAMEDLQRC
jgi:hypothetical protein